MAPPFFILVDFVDKESMRPTRSTSSMSVHFYFRTFLLFIPIQ